MATGIPGSQLRQLQYGFQVYRAPATLPQSGHAPIFNILNGPVMLTSLIGRVTTLYGTTGNQKLIAEVESTATDMCAVVASGTAAVGSYWSITGTPGDAMIKTVGIGKGFGFWGMVISTGTIDLSLSASDVGAAEWWLMYVPLRDGASVTAA